MSMLTWLVAIPLLGVVTGMRTFTPMTVLCWFAWAGRLPVQDTWASWTAKLPVAILFTILALAEYVGDKLPKAPNRNASVSLAARLIFGGLIGAIAAASLDGACIEGIILGVLGALIGAFASFLIRREIVTRLGSKDWPVALVEDISAILFAIFAMGVVTS